jgi:hypothetical protein
MAASAHETAPVDSGRLCPLAVAGDSFAASVTDSVLLRIVSLRISRQAIVIISRTGAVLEAAVQCLVRHIYSLNMREDGRDGLQDSADRFLML